MPENEKEKFVPAPPPPSDDVRRDYVGHTASLPIEGLTVTVFCNDVRNRYGNLDVLVTPMEGDGERWVKADRLSDLVVQR